MSAAAGYATGGKHGAAADPSAKCVQCGLILGKFLCTQFEEGWIHNDCVGNWKRKNREICAHCQQELPRERIIFKEKKFCAASHGPCLEDFKAGRVYERPSHSGPATKMACGRSKWFGAKNWKDRYFVLNPKTGGLLYYENEQAYRTGQKMKNMATISSGTRLITAPTCFIHPKAENPSKELIVIFQEGGKEYQLLMRCASWEEKNKWVRTITPYISTGAGGGIDLPTDLVEKYKRG